jgi:acetyl-CoA carboxylase biotin carboxyl carrier protein
MELDDLKDLIDLLKDTDITELQIEKEGTKVRIKRRTTAYPENVPAEEVSAVAEDRGESEKGEEKESLFTVVSPIVGTFYRSPSPEAPPFVDEGSRVTKGQVLCIIEAMKLMNEIESEFEGVIRKAIVENGQPVEYGEPLFHIEPL